MEWSDREPDREADRDPDRALVRRLLGGDEPAFEEFFAGYFPGLFRFAMARLRDPDAAEEVAQAAIVRALSRLATWRGEARLFTWLCTFCRHEISAWCQRNRRTALQVELIEDDFEVRAALELASGAGDPLRDYERSERSRLVQATLDHLPPRYGNALEWKYLEGLPVAEIAQRLEVSPKAAESILTRAREAFRRTWSALTGMEASS